MATKNLRTCIILGNGPSLRGFDFHRLSDFDTLGMNAAYRYWDRIGWYPTYYACLDDQVIKSHHSEIERLYTNGLIKKLFVHRGFFDYHPHRLGNKDFTVFDQTSKHWYNKFAKKHGLEPLFDRPAFRISDTSKITTGSHAVRYVANMGYERLFLLGIDLRYVEVLPEAVQTEGVGLRIDRTPKSNPNYFFDGYQKAGDLYNIPNPSVHQGVLHPKSFELIPKDFGANSLECVIFNGNRKSVLSDNNIFPFLPVERLLGESALGSICIPCNEREVPELLVNFDIWATAEYSPSYTVSSPSKPALVLVFNNRSAAKQQNSIRTAFYSKGMERFFSYIAFEYLDLKGTADAYVRDYKNPVGDEGYKSGPNNQFFGAMRLMKKYGRYTYLMEVDCVPVRRGWLDALQGIVSGSEDFWVMGGAYRGDDILSKGNARHINGNSVYATGDPDFQDFLTDFWEVHTWNMIRDVDKRLAYDCILSNLFTDDGLQDPELLSTWKSTIHLFRYTDYMQNISSASDLKKTDASLIEDIRRNYPNTFVLHNRTANRLVAEEVRSGVCTTFDPDRAASSWGLPPKILLLDMTAMGNSSATGELKSTLLADWPSDRLLQIAKQGPHGLASVRRENDRHVVTPLDAAATRKAIADFAPDLILYRPVPDTAALHTLAMEEISTRNLPLVTWLMDDWPARMEAEQPAAWKQMKPDLEYLLQASALRLSISEAMSEAFVRRYGLPFVPFANGIDPADWPAVPKRSDTDGIFRLRFAGGLASDMNRKSILQIAEAVERIGKSGIRISFQINTQKWWLEETKELFSRYRYTQMQVANLSPKVYREWISQADAVAIAYNFDASSCRYVQYSMANKMPECLASGAVLLAHGPKEIATIDYLAGTDAAVVVSEDSDQAVEKALLALHQDSARRNALAGRARALAFDKHNVVALRQKLREAIARAAQSTQSREDSVLPHGERSSRAHADLLDISARLLLDPQGVLAELEQDHTTRDHLDVALRHVPVSDPLRDHFLQVHAHVTNGIQARPSARE